MTPEQWRAAWILCETAGDLSSEEQLHYVQRATVDPQVSGRVITVLEEFARETSYPVAPDGRIAATVGRYKLLQQIGQGGMGEVFSAEDTELCRKVALKFLPIALAPDRAAASQVITEARLASSLNHPNIVTVYELIQTPWGLAMAMELVEGQSLRTLSKERRLPAKQILHIGRQVARALAAAHEKGIVHRDIKPENIMVRADGYVKVLDFGLAQNIRDQARNGASLQLACGTARYMSPEQKLQHRIEGASDVYSLALVLEELGMWRHPLLRRMRSAEPAERPRSEYVALQLERLEKSTNWSTLLRVSIAVLALLSLLLLLRHQKRNQPLPNLTLQRVTSYESGHDVTVTRLSPDGERLAYGTLDGGLILRNNRTLSVKELDGPPNFAYSQLLFLSDSTLLAVGIRGAAVETWSVPLNGSPGRRLFINRQLLALSHNRKRLAWVNEKHELLTGTLDETGAKLLLKIGHNERIVGLFWSANDKDLWINRVRECPAETNRWDFSFNPDNCKHSELISTSIGGGTTSIRLRDVRLNSGFFAGTGEFFFLRENENQYSSAGFNLWSLQSEKASTGVESTPRQLSHLNGIVLSQLTGSEDGEKLAVLRSDSTTQTYIADWQATPIPLLRNQRRLTLEQTSSYPHGWTPDGQSVIFESDRNGRFEIFRQKLNRREAELLVSTPGDVYMPQVSPDGKWLLMTYRDRVIAGKEDTLAQHSLVRAPIDGGSAVKVALHQPLDEFRCSLPGKGTHCILRTTEPDGYRFYELDPVGGQGPEVGHTSFTAAGLGRWSLSPDGKALVIPSTDSAGKFLEIHLHEDSSRASQVWRHIEGIGLLSSISYMQSGQGWLANTPTMDATVTKALLLALGDLFRAERLYYVDAQLRPHLILKSATNTFGVISPNGRQMALLGADMTSNVWSFQSDSAPRRSSLLSSVRDSLRHLGAYMDSARFARDLDQAFVGKTACIYPASKMRVVTVGP